MTEEAILRIKQEKKTLEPEFIQRIDREWEEVMKLFQGCRYDLSKIQIVRKYK